MLRSSISLKRCGYAVAEVLPSSCGIAVADINKFLCVHLCNTHTYLDMYIASKGATKGSYGASALVFEFYSADALKALLFLYVKALSLQVELSTVCQFHWDGLRIRTC
jgi:hypothetical protein